MTADAIRTDPRTHGEAVADVRYVMNLALIQRRFFRRLAASLQFINLFGGSAAFASVIAGHSQFLAVAGACLALVAMFELAFKPADRAGSFDAQYRAWAALRREVDEMDLKTLDARINLLRIDDPDPLETLRLIAYNRTQCEMGRPDHCASITWFHRLVSLFV